MNASNVVATLLILLPTTPVLAQSQVETPPLASSMRAKSVNTFVKMPLPRARPVSSVHKDAPEGAAGTDAECRDQVCWTVSWCVPGQDCPYKCQARLHACNRDRVTHLGD